MSGAANRCTNFVLSVKDCELALLLILRLQPFSLFFFQGGLKAVVWTDVFQAFVMVAGLITVFIVGTVNVCGFDKVWEINKERDRLTFFE